MFYSRVYRALKYPETPVKVSAFRIGKYNTTEGELIMLELFKRKSTKDRLEEIAVELKKDRHYIIVVPEDSDPQEILDTGFFDDYSVLIVTAGKLKIMEIG